MNMLDRIPCGFSDNVVYCNAKLERCCDAELRLCCLKTSDYDSDDKIHIHYNTYTEDLWYHKWYFWTGIAFLHLLVAVLLMVRYRMNRSRTIPYRSLPGNRNSPSNAAASPPWDNRQEPPPPPYSDITSSPPKPVQRNAEEAQTVEAIILCE